MNDSLRFRPTLEMLERRACPAFFAGLVNGNLVITATESANLSVEQIDSDSFSVSEFNSGTTVVIDGITNDVEMRLSDHHDSVSMYLFGRTVPGDLRIDLGDGDNYLLLGDFGGGVIGGDLRIRGGSGSDQMFLGDNIEFQELRVLGRTNIHTGSGDDMIAIGGSGQVSFSERAQIHLGDGDDALYLFAALFSQPSKAHGGCGHDVVIGSHPNLTLRDFE